jgi:hypothetical protein
VLVDPALAGEEAIETANGFATPRIRPLHDQRGNGRFEMRGVLLLGRRGRELERRDAVELREKRALPGAIELAAALAGAHGRGEIEELGGFPVDVRLRRPLDRRPVGIPARIESGAHGDRKRIRMSQALKHAELVHRPEQPHVDRAQALAHPVARFDRHGRDDRFVQVAPSLDDLDSFLPRLVAHRQMPPLPSHAVDRADRERPVRRRVEVREDDGHFTRAGLPAAEPLDLVGMVMRPFGTRRVEEPQSAQRQPISELDILEGRAVERLVEEHAFLEQQAAVDAHIARVEMPEIGERIVRQPVVAELLVADLRDVVHQVIDVQVVVPVDHAQRRHQAAEPLREGGVDVQDFRIRVNVVTEEQDPLALRGPDPGVARPGRSAVLVAQDLQRKVLHGFQVFSRLVGRPVVREDDLERKRGAARNAAPGLDDAGQPLHPVVGGNDDGDERRFARLE